MDPNIQEAYNLLSLIHEEKNDLKNSIYFLMIAAHLSQGDSEIWIKCFNLNKQIGNIQQAEYCISRAVKVEKDNPYLLYEKAIINEELNNFRKAANTYKKLLDISDSNSDILVHTANIYEKVLNNFDKAKNLLKMHFEKTEKKLMILNKLFNLLLDYSCFDEIIEFYVNLNKDDKINNNINKGNEVNGIIKKLFDNFVIKIIIKIAYLDLEQKKINNILDSSRTINGNETNSLSLNKKFNNNEEEIFFYFKELLLNDFKILIKEKDYFNDNNNNYNNINNSTTVFRMSKQQFLKFLNKIFEIYNSNDNLYKFVNFIEKIECDVYGFDTANNYFKIFDFASKQKIHFKYELELKMENYILLSDYFTNLKDYEKAIKFLNRAIYFSKLNSTGDYVYLVLKLSEILNKKGDYAESLEILNKINGNKENNIEKIINDEEKENFVENNSLNYFNKKEESNLDNNLEMNRTFSFRDALLNNDKKDNLINLNYDNRFEFNRNEILDEQQKCENVYLENLISNQDNIIQGENYENDFNAEENQNGSKEGNQESIIDWNGNINNNAQDNLDIMYNQNENNNLLKKNSVLKNEFYSLNNLNPNFEHKEFIRSKLLGRKRIRLSNKSFKVKNKNISNLTFDYFLRVKKNFEPEKNKTMEDFKKEYEILQAEVESNKKFYVTLQQSLIYLKTNKLLDFYDLTYESLRNILIQEIKISNYKTRLFYRLIMTSQNKNCFINSNADIFQEANFYQENPNENCAYINDNNLSIHNLNTSNEDAFSVFLGGYETIKENLFTTKDKNINNAFNRKKVRKTFDLVENFIKKIDICSKYINSKNLKMLIFYFISISFERKKYLECNEILKLMLSNESFTNKKDAFLFNIHIFAVLTNYYLENYKVAYQFMKKILLNFDLKNNFQFWVYFSLIANHLKLSAVRTTLYKLSKNRLLADNAYLNAVLSNCYLKTGNYNLSMKFLNILVEKLKIKDPICYFIMSLNFIFNSLSRKNKNKIYTFLKGNNLMNIYQSMRNKENPLEVLFNIGRFKQFIGHDKEAMKYYDSFILKLYQVDLEENLKEKLEKTVNYHYAMMLKKSGNEIEAHKMLLENIVI